jgi:hypothetical protein
MPFPGHARIENPHPVEFLLHTAADSRDVFRTRKPDEP